MNDNNSQRKPVAEGLPELCFAMLPSTGELICIKRGELGYYPSIWSTGARQRNQELADYNNQRLGVTVEQRVAMEAGSMGGWDIPSADPANYKDGMLAVTRSSEASRVKDGHGHTGFSRKEELYNKMIAWICEHIEDDAELFDVLHQQLGMSQDETHFLRRSMSPRMK